MVDSNTIVDAFNGAADDAAVLAAINTYAADLGLSQASLDKLVELPDGGGREKAIGLGVNEIKTLFGDFASLADIKQAVEQQISVEYAKFAALNAINGAGDADAMADALAAHVATLNSHRQALITEWSKSANPDVLDRVAELQADPYTTVLAEIVSHLDNEAYMVELAARILAARENGPFYGTGTLITALDAADEAIHVPPTVTVDMAGLAGGTSTVTITFSDAPEGFNQDADIQIEGGTLSNLTVDATGKVFTGTFTPSANFEGTASVTVKAASYTDAVGNLGTTGTDSLVVDTLAPTVAIDTVEGGNDLINAAEAAGGITFSGTVEAGSMVLVNGVAATVTGTTWTVTLDAPIEDGELEVEVVATDAAGNTKTVAKTLTIDTQAPDAPVLTQVGQGFSVVAGAVITILIDGETAILANFFDRTTTVDGKDLYTAKNGKFDGSEVVDIIAKVTDAAGNTTEITEADVSFDTTVTLTVKVENDDDVINAVEAADGITLSGTVEAGSTVLVNGVAATVTGTTWTVTLDAPVADGELEVEVVATDATGNTKTVPKTLTVDTQAPNPGMLTFVGQDDTGSVDGITRDNRFDLALFGNELESTVVYQFSKDGGEWTTTGTSHANLEDGSYQFRAVVTDAAGNSDTTDVISVTIDATSVAPVVTSILKDTGSSDTDNLTNFKDQAICGTAEANSEVEVILVGSNGLEYQFATTADAEGNWEVLSTGELPDATYTVTAVSVDRTGNMRASKSPYTFTVETQAPSVASITVSDTLLRTREKAVVTLIFSEKVALTEDDLEAENGELTGLETTDGGLTWTATFTPDANTQNTTGVITVKDGFKDLAGNEGIGETSNVFKIDTLNDAPTDIALTGGSVFEFAAKGTLVGTLSATDADAEETFTYTLLDNAGGRFAISGNKIVVANGVALDYEQSKAHQVKVQVKDANGATRVETFSLRVQDVAVEKVVGTSGKDVIKGGSKNDNLSGGNGDDLLYGGAGNDFLTGGSGKDAFVFDTALNKSTNVDTIKSFSVTDDTIRLENSIFKKLTKTGTLSKDFFTIGEKAKDKNDYIVYDSKTGALSYDADGSGKGAAIKFAQLDKNLKLTEKDFFVI